MFVKRIERKNAFAQVGNTISKCAHCGNPIVGIIKLGAKGKTQLCPSCSIKQTEPEPESANEEIDDQTPDR